MAGAELRLLAHEMQLQRQPPRSATGGFHRLGAVPGDQHRAARAQSARRIEHMAYQWPAGKTVQYFG